MKTILSLIISGALVVSGFGQTRNVLVGTNNAVVQPTNFWSADASNARTGLGLGSASTNDATAFQPASVLLSNLAVSNGAALTNLAASNIAGTLSLGQGGTGATNASNARTALGLGTAATNDASAFQPSSSALTNISLGNGGTLTNLSATSIVGQIPSTNLPTASFTNLSGTLSVAQGGTGATNAANARQNLGSTTVGDAVFIATNAAAARTAIGALAPNGDATNLTNFPASLLRTNGSGAGLTNLTAANITGTVALASNVTGTIAISNGGTGATNAGGARTNLGLGATWLTNGNAAVFRTQIGLGLTNDVQFGTLNVTTITSSLGDLVLYGFSVQSPQFIVRSNALNVPAFSGIQFEAPELASITRTNLGLGWPALTNTNAGTGLVSVNTNGEVVSPTNFWQVAPIVTRFVEFDPPTNATTNIVAARNLHIHSLAISRTGVTSTIALPTNNVFNGDIALVVHQGPTSSVTAVRTAGASTNLVTLNQFDEAVEFVYYNNTWQFNHNRSFVEPIYFSGTNAAANVAASRTNLGIPLAALTNTNNANFRTAIELGATNNVAFSNVTVSGALTATGSVTTISNMVVGGTLTSTGVVTALSNVAIAGTLTATGAVTTVTNVNVGGAINVTNKAETRTNLGLGTTNDVVFANTRVNSLSITNTTNVTSVINFLADWSGGRSVLNIFGYTSNGEGEKKLLEVYSFGIVFEEDQYISWGGGGTNSGAVNTRNELGLGTDNDVTFSNVTASGTLTATSTVTAKTNLVVEGFVNYTAARTNNSPTNTPNFAAHAAWIEVKIGTNSFFLPAYQ